MESHFCITRGTMEQRTVKHRKLRFSEHMDQRNRKLQSIEHHKLRHFIHHVSGQHTEYFSLVRITSARQYIRNKQAGTLLNHGVEQIITSHGLL